MNKNYFPQTFLQSIIFLIVPILLVTPVIYLKTLNIISANKFTNIFFVVFIINVFIFFYLKNDKKLINFNFKVSKLIIIFIVLVITFQLAINLPINFIINSILNDNKINTNHGIIGAIPILIMASIFEEFIFRGMILKGYLIRYKPRKAIMISALFFGLIHLNPMQIFGAIIFGVLSGYIFFFSKSIGMTITLHFINNMIAAYGVYMLNNYGNLKINKTTDLYGNYSIYIIVVSFLTLLYTIFYIYKNKEQIIKKLKQLDAPRRLPI